MAIKKVKNSPPTFKKLPRVFLNSNKATALEDISLLCCGFAILIIPRTANIVLMKRRLKQKAFVNKEIFIDNIRKDYEKIKLRLVKKP